MSNITLTLSSKRLKIQQGCIDDLPQYVHVCELRATSYELPYFGTSVGKPSLRNHLTSEVICAQVRDLSE